MLPKTATLLGSVTLLSDLSFELQTARVTSKAELGFYPKRWEERELPIPAKLIDLLKKQTRRAGCKFVFPSPAGNREYHMLDPYKAVAERAGLDPAEFDLKTFRSTYATQTLRAGFDVRTVQHWISGDQIQNRKLGHYAGQKEAGKLDRASVPSRPGSSVAPDRTWMST